MREVSIEEFHTIVENEDDIHIIDVRPRDLYGKGHVPGAINIPLSELKDHFETLDQDKHYYAICHDGIGSKKATELLSKNGFKVTNVEKGVPFYPGEIN